MLNLSVTTKITAQPRKNIDTAPKLQHFDDFDEHKANMLSSQERRES